MGSPTITLRVPEDTEAALTALSEATGRAVGDLVRQGIDMLLDDLDGDTVAQLLEESRRKKDEALRRAKLAAAEAQRAREELREARSALTEERQTEEQQTEEA